jgi:hypothetical protein
MRWNDDLDDTTRQRLLPYAARTIDGRVVPGPLAGTAGDGHDERRAWLLVDWQVRVFAPAWLRLVGLVREADRLAGAAEIVDRDSLAAVQAVLEQARKKAAAAGNAAGNAAWDAAWSAGRAAAGAAAGDAAGAAAWSAARDAAGSAAGAAARAAARAAAWAVAAGNAARDALQPTVRDALQSTVVELQTSAFRLLDRLIDPMEVASWGPCPASTPPEGRPTNVIDTDAAAGAVGA